MMMRVWLQAVKYAQRARMALASLMLVVPEWDTIRARCRTIILNHVSV